MTLFNNQDVSYFITKNYIMGIFSIIGLLIVLLTAAYWLCPEHWLGHKMRSVYVTLVACCIYWAAFMVVHAACGGFSHTLSGVTVWMAVATLLVMHTQM